MPAKKKAKKPEYSDYHKAMLADNNCFESFEKAESILNTFKKVLKNESS